MSSEKLDYSYFVMSRRTGVLQDSRLEEGRHGSLDIEGRLRITGFGAHLCVDMAIVIVELQRVFLNVRQRDWLKQ